MKSISKADVETRDGIVSRLRNSWDAMESEMERVSGAIGDFNQLVESHNEIVSEANAFVEEIASQIEGYMDERSDKWREGDRGSAYEDWQNAWSSVSAEEVEPLEEPSMPDGDSLADDLENLPEAPE